MRIVLYYTDRLAGLLTAALFCTHVLPVLIAHQPILCSCNGQLFACCFTYLFFHDKCSLFSVNTNYYTYIYSVTVYKCYCLVLVDVLQCVPSDLFALPLGCYG